MQVGRKKVKRSKAELNRFGVKAKGYQSDAQTSKGSR